MHVFILNISLLFLSYFFSRHQQFSVISSLLIDPNTQGLPSNWEEILSIKLHTKKLLALQAIEMILKIAEFSPFEKYDFACVLYSKLLNKISFQLVINSFIDIEDRQNLLLLLKKNNNLKKNIFLNDFTANCMVQTSSTTSQHIRENTENERK